MKYRNAVILTFSLFISGGAVVNAASTTKSSWLNCNVNSCTEGGSATVKSTYTLAPLATKSSVIPFQYCKGPTAEKPAIP
jgi:triacylglycerol lipase